MKVEVVLIDGIKEALDRLEQTLVLWALCGSMPLENGEAGRHG